MIAQTKTVPLPNYESDYEIRSDGWIRRISKTTRTEKGWFHGSKTSHNYRNVTLTRANKCTRFYLHRLIASAFHANPLNLPQVNHIDGNGQNNDASNLEWVSASQNLLHRSRVLGKEIGENHHAAKLTNVLVYKIRRMFSEGMTAPGISRELGIHRRTISAVKTGLTWRHLLPTNET